MQNVNTIEDGKILGAMLGSAALLTAAYYLLLATLSATLAG